MESTELSVVAGDVATLAPGLGCWELATHNGFVTIRSKRTGDHRTIKVSTQAEDAKFFPGRRLVSLLVGPDNQADYRSFGYVDGDRVVLWKKHRESDFFAWIATALANPGHFSDTAEFMTDARCVRCNRPLTDPDSIRLGIGPTCREAD
jgi:hypothetical protein